MKVTITHEIPEQDVIDLIVTAVEGSIDYWCPKVAIVNGKPAKTMETFSETLGAVVNNGGTIQFAEDEEENGNPDDYKWHELDAAKLEKGFQKYFERKDASTDPGDWDAEVSDIIIQFALFGEIIYG